MIPIFCIFNPIPSPPSYYEAGSLGVPWELQSPVRGICQQLALNLVIGPDCFKLALSGLVNL